MKFLPITFLLIGWTVSFAEEPLEVKEPKGLVRAVSAPRAWLGLQVSKPDPSMTSQLPSLPQGIGFVIASVDEDGPAQTAGLKKFDLLWKLGDQMLVN
jgi:S1-C subfamily serine protease